MFQVYTRIVRPPSLLNVCAPRYSAEQWELMRRCSAAVRLITHTQPPVDERYALLAAVVWPEEKWPKAA